MIEVVLDMAAVGVQGLEVAHDLTDGVHNGEGVGILADNPGNGGDLGLVHHADQHIGLPAGVHALGRDQGCGVLDLADDLVGDFLGVIRDDFEADSLPAALDPAFHQGGSGEAVKDAHDDRLHLIAVDEVAGDGDNDIHNKRQTVDALLGMLHMDQGRYEIRAAGIGTGPGQNGAVKAMDNAGHQGAQDLTGAVGGGIGEHGKIHMVQNDQTQRKCYHIDHAPKSNGLRALEVAHGSQRHIDQQAQGTHIDAEDMLDDGADAVDTGGSKLIGKDKQLIIQGSDQADTGNNKVSPNFF